ncbi:hypothetical protein HMPREF3208_00841 [Gardnerella vaginalis]|uniref:Uncharacterized protein n=1 Tax=Gardnerella vaginalis TaxID=2702 RepID=A0A133NVF6_GARVA|nr:hypothetical protein HMPREF3208_00841 [Gardnerella vaginalis]
MLYSLLYVVSTGWEVILVKNAVISNDVKERANSSVFMLMLLQL